MTEHIYESETDDDNDITAVLGPREKIIRCRDCKYYAPSDEGFFICDRGWMVYAPDDGGEYVMRVEVEPGGFCAWAERDADD